MQFAFHKDQSTFFAKLVSWKMQGPYSHVEAVFEAQEDGTHLCASSAFKDGGVRFKRVALDPAAWDIIDVPCVNRDIVWHWFSMYEGAKYNVRGLLDFLLPFPVGDCKNGYFCDEACGDAAGLKKSSRFDPNGFAAILEFAGGNWVQRVDTVASQLDGVLNDQ